MLDMYENLHYQYENGFIDEEHWHKSIFQLSNLTTPRSVRSIVSERLANQGYRSSFSAFVLELISNAADDGEAETRDGS